ncbi:hypothetical protein [Acinetobacter shaoyimingii]|uniref:Uncharacterized protein n=1 Tax=Acinetobacter shaoyimingii TaxID=2715164 RepID=A0A6G8RY28_9GAMM|nr:hypothetical protein [Acinetobacter shaoyimingii]NHB57584.1 hypothetical protein [Acinetobacter shaoyimingii]QIO06708.1 hypothetical protein G8E00_12530 [Acinetobacter shaoyimingii]
MTHDFNKPPHVTTQEEVKQKKRIPVFILILVGIFLASFIFYIVSDKNPKGKSVPANENVPAVQDPNSSNNSNANKSSASDD